jgi:esterase/lipase
LIFTRHLHDIGANEYMTIPARLRPSGFNNQFDSDGLPFHQYIDKMRVMIAKARVDLTPENKSFFIDANSPYELFPTSNPSASQNNEQTHTHQSSSPTKKFKNGILMIHGLFDSPYYLKEIANHLHKKGFLAKGILLPGHGTVPGDLINMKNTEWIKAVRYGIKSFQGQVDNLYLGGFSTGALLALSFAFEDDSIKGLILLSPAVRVRPRLPFFAQQWTKWHTCLSYFCNRCQWFNIGPDADFAKYESLSFNAAYQVYLLTQQLALKNRQRSLSIPIFIAISKNDEVIDTPAVIDFFNQQPNPHNKMILYSTENDSSLNARIQQINSRIPEENIVDFSHICIPFPANNPHYGKKGDAYEFEWLLSNTGKLVKKKNSGLNSLLNKNNRNTQNANNEIHYGSLSLHNLKTYPMHRLSYNPYFDNMLEAMDNFTGL